jgi:hypothetical protein
MKRIALFVLGVMAVSISVFAQAPAGRGSAPAATLAPGVTEADLEVALLAAPANLKAGATVIKWKPDFTYDTLRKGTNRLVCMDRTGHPTQQPFMSECTSVANLDRLAQNLKAEATGDKAKSEAMLNEMEKNGTRIKPEFGSVWYHVMGADAEHTRNHMTIAVPGATSKTLGFPETGAQGGVWIMNAGTTTAHIMTPGE